MRRDPAEIAPAAATAALCTLPAVYRVSGYVMLSNTLSFYLDKELSTRWFIPALNTNCKETCMVSNVFIEKG